METKKKILVIDDELYGKMERKSHYENAFAGNYDVKYVEDEKLIYYTIKKSHADLYIVDLNLDKYTDPKTNKSLYVGSVLDEIGKDKPIILLSASYPDLAEKGELTCIINNASEKGFNVGTFLTWREILDASEKEDRGYKDALYSKIDFMINRDRSPYDFGIICALQDELTPFNEILEEESISHKVDNIHYINNTLKTKSGRILNFIAASTFNMGIADSGIIATHMASKMGIKNIYMIGVCGGRESEVNIGDVIIPGESVAYQCGKLKEDGFSPDIQIAKPKSDGFYKDMRSNEALAAIYEKYTSKLIREEKRSLGLGVPKVRYDPMACGDYVINKKEALDEIAKFTSKRKLCAVDMESYAIYRVGEIMDVNTMVIKSVMDLSNNKSDKYKSYAAYMAAHYLYHLIYDEIIEL